MSLLAGTNYDPSTAATKLCSSLLPMTAVDTTNLRLSFTAPSNGCVMVRERCTISGSTVFPTILLGVLSGTTVVARQSPSGALGGTSASATNVTQETLFTISGLTSGSSYVWDAVS